MQNGVMKAWLESSHLAGANATYVVKDSTSWDFSDPELVDEQWRDIFVELPAVNETAVEQPHSRVRDYFRRLAKNQLFKCYQSVIQM